MREVNVWVSSRGNQFMNDIADWMCEAARLAGRNARVLTDGLPAQGQAIDLVVAPHEFFSLSDDSDADVARAAAACIPVCTEQPGTPWFNLAAGIVRDCRFAIDINPHGVEMLRARGFEAAHLQLGGVPSMVSPHVERDVDVLFLGGLTARRGAVLAPLAPRLWDRSTELRLFRFTAPVHGAVPGVVFGREKYDLLARSRILLNVHRDDREHGYFEWARMVEAMANGCAVLTEPSTGFEPLVEGCHFVAVADLGPYLDDLLDDPNRCRELGESARSAMLDDHALVRSLGPLLDRIDDLDPSARPHRAHRKPAPRHHQSPLMTEFRPADTLRRDLYVALMREQHLLRSIDRVRCEARYGAPDVTVRHETPTYATAEPAISVIVTLYDYALLVHSTLRSIVESEGVDIEVVVVDDHSHDDGRARTIEFMDLHPHVPIVLIGSETNRGLPAARNLGIEVARCDLIMMMDADNLLYPNCLSELTTALEDDPGAAFAYATLEAFGHDPGLRSELSWFPRWLCETNYIDAQALIRRSTFDRWGKYRVGDDFVHGWEDWELWLRLAEAGERGRHVPSMLGRYRTQASSMITVTNLVAVDMRAHLRELHPGLPWPEDDLVGS